MEQLYFAFAFAYIFVPLLVTLVCSYPHIKKERQKKWKADQEAQMRASSTMYTGVWPPPATTYQLPEQTRWVLCHQCQRASLEYEWTIDGMICCPYDDCPQIGQAAFEWNWLRESLPHLPEIPERCHVYTEPNVSQS